MKGREGERNIPSFPPVFFMTTRAIAALLRLWAMIFIPAHASGPMFRWLQKALVIQQLIHLFQLGRQRTKRFWQDRIPKRQLVLPQIQHFHHPARICRGGSRISLIKEFSPCGLLCGWVWLGHLTVSTRGAEFLSF